MTSMRGGRNRLYANPSSVPKAKPGGGDPDDIPRGKGKLTPPGDPAEARHPDKSRSAARKAHSGSPYRLPIRDKRDTDDIR